MYVGQTIFAVADGMGGHRAGAEAAETALEPVAHLDRDVPADDDVERVLRDAIVAANAQVIARAANDPSRQGMGTTVTAMAISQGRAHLAFVGDSRAYRLRGGALEQLSTDHTLVQRLVEQGALLPHEVVDHPQRSLITRGVGLHRELDVDIAVTDVAKGDTFLLCSDGLTGAVDDNTIAAVLQRHDTAPAAADALIESALQGGGLDDITVIVVHVDRI